MKIGIKRSNIINYLKTDFNKVFIGVFIFHIIMLYLLPGLKEVNIEPPKLTRITLGENNNTEDAAPKINNKTPKTSDDNLINASIEAPKINEKLKNINSQTKVKLSSVTSIKPIQSIDDFDLLENINSNRVAPTFTQKDEKKLIEILEEDIVHHNASKINDVEKPYQNKFDSKFHDIETPIIDTQVITTDLGSLNKNPDVEVENTKFDDLINEEFSNILGSKSGLKVGAVDGKSTVYWDPSNKDPEYPLEAEEKALTADAKVILDVDSNGNVLKVMPVRTGVEVIDRAVEEVAYSWNVKLISNGMSISGKVMVEYKFKLKGRE